MAISEELVSILATHNVYIQRLAAQYGNEAATYIEKIREDIAARVEKEVGKNLTDKRKDSLYKDISEIVNFNLNQYVDDLKKNHVDLGFYEASYQAKTLKDVFPAIVETATVTKSAIDKSAKNTLIKLGEASYTSYTQLLSNFTTSNAQQIDNIIRNGFVGGVTNRDIATQVMKEVDSQLIKTKRNALTVARNGTNHYANQARKVYFAEDDAVIGTRRISTLDSATSQYCRSIDQTVVLKDDPDFNKAFAPFHAGCRTANTPEPAKRYLDDATGKRPENFRNAETGLLDPKQTSSKKIYYEAMKSLDAKSQDAILGVTLGKAFRKGLKTGELTPQSFASMTIDKTLNKGLTLAEMAKKDNALGRILIEQNKGKSNYLGRQLG